MTVFVTSDHHFGHKNIIHYCGRPFQDVAHMDACLIELWNANVSPEDAVFNLGDVSLGKGRYVEDRLKKLNGRQCLITGNHDQRSLQELSVWSKVVAVFHWERKGRVIHMRHLPWTVEDVMGIENGFDYGRHVYLSGHVHGQNGLVYTNGVKQVDVGVDNWQYQPIPIETAIEYFDEYECIKSLDKSSDMGYSSNHGRTV